MRVQCVINAIEDISCSHWHLTMENNINRDRLFVFNGIKKKSIINLNFSPFQDYNDKLSIYCGDCLDDSMKWEKSRVCSYNYEILSGTDLGAYHIVNNDTPLIYYVMPFDGLPEKNGEIPAPFRTELCKGCSGFCMIANQTC